MAEQSTSMERVELPPDLSAERALDLVQRMTVDSLRMLQLDLEERGRALLRRFAWVGVGAFCLIVAWLGLLSAAVLVLAERIPLEASLLLVSTSQILLGALLIVWGRARERR
jgi:hypothetical protein